MAAIRRRTRKKGIVYEVVVDLGDDSEGKRQQRTRSFPSLREAKVGQAKWLSEISMGLYVDRSTATVTSVLRDWLETEAAHRVKPSTLAHYRHIIEYHILPDLGGIQVQKLTPLQVQRYYTGKLTAGCSPWLVNQCHMRLRQALSMATRLGVVQRNATDSVTPPAYKTKEMQTWTIAEAHTYLEAARGNRMWPLWEVALTTGMRKGELLGLQWKDIDFEAATIHVQRAVYRSWTSGTKTDKGNRTVPLLPEPLESLRQHRRRQHEQRLALGPAWPNTDTIFCTLEGQPYHPSNITVEHSKLLDQSGVKRLRFHDLRHTYATQAIASGIPVPVVSEILGHTKVSITMDTYAHVLPHQHQEVRERLHTLFYGGL